MTAACAVGVIPAELVKETTGGKADWEIPVDLNTKLMKEQWDLIINVGHVVPHEVLGFANHNKNYFIGLGGKDTICASHMAAAVYGIENNLGQPGHAAAGLLQLGGRRAPRRTCRTCICRS